MCFVCIIEVKGPSAHVMISRDTTDKHIYIYILGHLGDAFVQSNLQ